jgi:hypothetical protein
MADSKITALTSIGTSTDPVLDQMVIVDVSDGSMAATGTTKKVSLNQLLSSNPSATGGLTLSGALAAGTATITGDLTVDTSTLKVDSANNRVGIGTTSPAFLIDAQQNSTGAVYGSVANNDTSGTGSVRFRLFNSGDVSDGFALINNYGASGQVNLLNYKASSLALWTNSSQRYQISSSGVHTWENVGGVAGTAMTLNSTGLGVGAAPTAKLHVSGTGTQTLRVETLTSGNPTLNLLASGQDTCSILYDRSNNYMRFDVSSTTGALILSRDGNVGVGVTPKTWSTGSVIEVGNYFMKVAGSGTFGGAITNNAYYNSGWKYVAANNATFYQSLSGEHRWLNAPSGIADAAITFTQAMTLDASGRLFVGATSITAGYTGNNYFVVGGVTSPTIKLQSTTGPAAWDIYSAGGLDLFLGYNAVDKGQFSRTTGAYTALSDANKKKDFEPSNIGLAEVLKLKPTLFRMIGAADDSSKELGFVAQDVQSVIPQAYVEAESQGGKFIGLQDRPIIAALTRAIQELTARVEALEA